MNKKIICKLCDLQSNIGNCDLDSHQHKGFTVGKGKVMYWYIVWHPSCNASIYTSEREIRRRYVRGDIEITIHFK